MTNRNPITELKAAADPGRVASALGLDRADAPLPPPPAPPRKRLIFAENVAIRIAIGIEQGYPCNGKQAGTLAIIDGY